MKRKILVVDDDSQIVYFVTISLKQAGYDVYTAEDGEQGLAMARKVRPELMILDLNMPVMHGFEVCQKVREDKTFDDMKILVTSAKSYLVDIKTASNLGANLYLVKPYGLKQLLEAVGKLIPSA